MRRFYFALIMAGVLACGACNRPKVQVQQTVEEPAAPSLASTVTMGDPKLAVQLVSGFHDIEANAWRWTAQRFSVVLRPPAGAAQKGAVLELKLSVPPPSIQKLHTLTLSASIGGTPLAPETYSAAGGYSYKRDVPAAALNGGSVRIDFQLDKAVPPGDGDQRELGVVVLKAGLAPK